MPDVRLPDGTVIRNVPEGTTRSQLMARVGKAQAPDSRPTSFFRGVGEGIMQPLNNAARALETGLDKVGLAQPIQRVGEALGMAPSVNAAVQQQQRNAASAPTRGSSTGRLVGNIVGTLPLARLPGGAFTQGAAGGALLTDKRDPRGIAEDAFIGGIAGKVGEKAVKGLARVINPRVAPVVQRLQKAGVRLTPGQILGASDSKVGRIVKGFEDKASSIPIVGDLVSGARRRSVEDFNRAALSEPLKSIGAKLPKDAGPGHSGIAAVERALGDAYDDVLPKLSVRADQQFTDDLANFAQDADTLLPERAAQFARIMQSDVGKNFDQAGGLAGEGLKAVESRLGKRIRTYGGSADPDASDMADLLRQVQSSIREMAARQNPAQAGRLRDINEGFAKFTRVQSAASKANEGIFTPGQLRTATRIMDTSTRKGQSARGGALMQGLAEDAQSVLPSSVPDSGTAGRLAALLGGAGYIEPTAAIAGGAAMLPYTQVGGKAAEWLLTGRQGQTAKGLADLLRLTSPFAAGTAAAIPSNAP